MAITYPIYTSTSLSAANTNDSTCTTCSIDTSDDSYVITSTQNQYNFEDQEYDENVFLKELKKPSIKNVKILNQTVSIPKRKQFTSFFHRIIQKI